MWWVLALRVVGDCLVCGGCSVFLKLVLESRNEAAGLVILLLFAANPGPCREVCWLGIQAIAL